MRAAAVTVSNADVYITVTLCRFDDKPWGRPQMGPFIPCERRLAHMENMEIQGRDIWTMFLKQGLCQASSRFLVDTPDL